MDRPRQRWHDDDVITVAMTVNDSPSSAGCTAFADWVEQMSVDLQPAPSTSGQTSPVAWRRSPQPDRFYMPEDSAAVAVLHNFVGPVP